MDSRTLQFKLFVSDHVKHVLGGASKAEHSSVQYRQQLFMKAVAIARISYWVALAAHSPGIPSVLR